MSAPDWRSQAKKRSYTLLRRRMLHSSDILDHQAEVIEEFCAVYDDLDKDGKMKRLSLKLLRTAYELRIARGLVK